MNKKISALLALVMSMSMAMSVTACFESDTKESPANSEEISSEIVTSEEVSSEEISSEEVSSEETSEETSEEIVDDGKPKANVVVADATALSAWNAEGVEFYYNKGTMATLETGYTFSATETVEEAKANEYAKWYADYYVYVDSDIAADTLGLAGSYQSWDNGKWLAFYAPELKANQVMGLLASVNIKWTYEEIVEYVVDFRCGAFDNNNACSGVTLTVELRLTNPENAEDYFVVNSTSYKFA